MSRLAISRIAKTADAGCPFCRSDFHLDPQLGDQIFFLSGLEMGTWGRVVPAGRTLRVGEFCIQKGLRPLEFSVCHNERDRSLPIYAYRVPDWMPSLSMEDSLHFHESLFQCLLLPDEGAAPATIFEAVEHVVTCCWSHRLPMTSRDIWQNLKAHGLPDIYQEPICCAYDYGVRLAKNLNGRPPNGRRKMPAMSRIKYLTKGNEALWAQVKRHDNFPEIFKDDDGSMKMAGSQ